jgi:hypothetical protein
MQSHQHYTTSICEAILSQSLCDVVVTGSLPPKRQVRRVHGYSNDFIRRVS